jgi:hypothetical protein
MDASAAGHVHGGAMSPVLSDEEWKAVADRFLSEHDPLSASEGERFFIGWTAPRAWWEAE